MAVQRHAVQARLLKAQVARAVKARVGVVEMDLHAVAPGAQQQVGFAVLYARLRGGYQRQLAAGLLDKPHLAHDVGQRVVIVAYQLYRQPAVARQQLLRQVDGPFGIDMAALKYLAAEHLLTAQQHAELGPLAAAQVLRRPVELLLVGHRRHEVGQQVVPVGLDKEGALYVHLALIARALEPYAHMRGGVARYRYGLLKLRPVVVALGQVDEPGLVRRECHRVRAHALAPEPQLHAHAQIASLGELKAPGMRPNAHAPVLSDRLQRQVREHRRPHHLLVHAPGVPLGAT